MPTVGFNTPFPKTRTTRFVVENITIGTRWEKVVRLFNYPIDPGKNRDLLTIPEVSEADIRHALLKGDLKIKLENKEVRVIDSNIDLLQFDSDQKIFLQSVGVVDGLEVNAGGSFDFTFKQGISLGGSINGANTVFTTPDKFINGYLGANQFRILVQHNGRILVESVDYLISESAGIGTGYDTITLISFIPITGSTMVADYVVAA